MNFPKQEKRQNYVFSGLVLKTPYCTRSVYRILSSLKSKSILNAVASDHSLIQRLGRIRPKL